MLEFLHFRDVRANQIAFAERRRLIIYKQGASVGRRALCSNKADIILFKES